MPSEEWRDVSGYEGFYQVSNLGRVRSLDRVCEQVGVTKEYCDNYTKRGKILKQNVRHTYDKRGRTPYYRHIVTLYDENGARRYFKVHRLVAQAFVPNPDNKPFVNHIDCDPSNNAASNLEWCTPKENVAWMDKLNRRNSKVVSVKATDVKTGIETVYESLEAAEDATGCSKAHICGCCRGYSGRKTSGGFYWSYA